MAFASTDDGLSSCDKFSNVERLCKIVVCPGIRKFDQVILVFSRCENKDRTSQTFRSQCLESLLSAQFWQHEAEYDHVELGLFRLVKTVFAIECTCLRGSERGHLRSFSNVVARDGTGYRSMPLDEHRTRDGYHPYTPLKISDLRSHPPTRLLTGEQGELGSVIDGQ